MPTYTNPNAGPYTAAGLEINGGETRTVKKTLTEIEIELPSAVAGLGLELVTEAGSGATGRIYWIRGAVIGLVGVLGTFTGEAALTADVTGALGTPAADALQVILTRDTATDFFTSLIRRQVVTATTEETKDVYISRESTWIAVVSLDVAVVILNGASGDTVFSLPSGNWVDRNDQRYQYLQLEFAGAGSCEVLEFDSDFNPMSYSDVGGSGNNPSIPSPTTIVETGSGQTFTAAWVDVATEFYAGDTESIGIWLTVDINDSLDARFRVLAKHTSGGSEEYNLPIKTISASDIKIEDEYFELNVDADQLVIIQVATDRLIPYIQVQCMVGTLGASAGELSAMYITKA